MMEKKYARLAALLTVAVLCGNGAPSMAANEVGTEENGWHTVIDSDYTGPVYGNQNDPDTTTGAVTGHVEMTGGTVNGEIYGGYSSSSGYGGAVTGSTVTITGGIAGWNVYGGWGNTDATGNTVTITGGSTVKDSVYGGYSNGGAVTGNTVTINGGEVSRNVYGGWSNGGAVTGNTVTINGGEVGRNVYGGWSNGGAVTGNTVTITGGSTVENRVYGGYSNKGAATGNTVTINGGEVGRNVYGGYSNTGSATGNTVTITNGEVTGDVYGGQSNVGTVSDNTLVVGGGSSTVGGLRNFNTIRFQGVTWDSGGTLLTITNGAEGDLENTKIDAENLVIHGSTPQAGESMTFIKNEKADTGLSAEQAAGGFTQGVATAGTAKWNMQEDGKTLNYTITGVFRNRQTDLIAENRLAGAAFVNQGADIAADSLRLLDDGYHFGTQTFGAVYGNRSQYDVASDIKINGWSEIAGFGNIHEVKGGRLAWGVFYENGTGNYRTWNTFNNEMFRGDGSLLYNGGGAAVRLTKDSGMYYEASLRAGTLSSMTDAVRDGYGNSYGFDSDSTYWGAHVGAGKLIQRGSGQWDIYGKYFHTDIDGDSFEMGGDRFSFDSVTSDRLRLGARYTADTDKAWSLYCGAAYEYEFSGDSHMKAGQFEAPEQSLQGSTVFGEIGTVWGRKDSPWSMDINLRGYAGEREGFSGMVQLAYAF